MRAHGQTVANRKRRLWRFMLAVVLLLFCVAYGLPWLIAKTQLRDSIVNRVLGMSHLTASSRDASLGWLSPARIEGLRLEGEKKRFQVHVERIESQQSWPVMLAKAPDIGRFSIESPDVFINMPLAFFEIPEPQVSPLFTANITNARLHVGYGDRENSLIDIDQIHLTAHVEDSGNHRTLILDPVDLFVRRKLRPDHCSRLLQLLSPSMRYATRAQGSYSLSIDKASVPLGVDREAFINQLQLAGELTLHDVLLDSESPILQAVSQIVSDLYGQVTPERTRVAKDSTIAFEVRHGRLHHDGLELGFPDIDPELLVRASGSVGIDESLDLQLSIPRLDKTKRSQKGPVHCRVTGTVSHPVIKATDASLVLRVPGSEKRLLDVDGVDLTARVVDVENGKVLSFEPFLAMDHQQLQRGSVGGLLSWLDPSLKLNPQLAGELSLSIQTLNVPLGVAPETLINETEVVGRLSIHDFNSDVTAPLRHALVKLVSDLYGRQVSDVITVAHNTEVEFELHNGRLHFDGLQMGLPDIDPVLQIQSSGSVGLDETLDIRLQVPRLNEAKRRRSGPVVCEITGTMNNPVISVNDASLVVQLPDRDEPLLDVDEVDFTMRLITSPAGKAISIDPAKILQRQPINRRLASGLLHLVDPEIRYSPELTGRVSMSLDQLVIPFGVSDQEFLEQIQMTGTLSIHEVTSIATTPLRRAVIKLLADSYGKQPGDKVRVAHDTDVKFALQNGKVRFDGLEIGFPDIDPELQISASGMVGLDESLDIHFNLPAAMETSGVLKTTGKLHITGTLKHPHVSVADAALKIHLQDPADPVLELDKIDFQFSIESEGNTDYLNFEPFEVFEKQRLESDLCHGLLTMVAPTLDAMAELSGEISLAIDTFRIPLNDQTRIIDGTVLAGRLELHEVKADSKTPLMSSMIKILMDQYGNSMEGPVEVAKNATIRFVLENGRINHAGFQFGLPGVSEDLVAKSSGSVGLDRTLDLKVEVPRFVVSGLSVPVADHANPVVFRITGTIDDPVVEEIGR